MFDVFQNVLAEIQSSISEVAFRTWFEKVELVSLDEDTKTATIGAPNIFKIKTLEAKYKDALLKAFKHNNIELRQLLFILNGDGNTHVKAREIRNDDAIRSVRKSQVLSAGDIAEHVKQTKPNPTGLSSKYTLDNFIVGSSNELAAGVAQLIVKNPGEKKFNPFFLYGGPGLGKTHLVQGIGNAIVKAHPELKVLYIPMNHFYAEFIRSVMAKRGDEFVKKYQKLDVLIVDDFQMIMKKDRSQEEFFNIFNDLHQANKQIIVTCDRTPDQIQTLDVRLSSRLASAGAYDLQFPGFEDRCAILKSKAELMGEEIEDAAIEYIAENIKTNIRELEGEFQKIMVTAEIKGMTPLELINEGYVSGTPRRQRNITPKHVVEKVAKYYNLTVVEMTGKSRVANIKTARQVAMYILSKELGMSTTKIAPEVGVKDHTTVMNGIKKIDTDQVSNLQLRDQINQIKAAIYG